MYHYCGVPMIWLTEKSGFCLLRNAVMNCALQECSHQIHVTVEHEGRVESGCNFSVFKVSLCFVSTPISVNTKRKGELSVFSGVFYRFRCSNVSLAFFLLVMWCGVRWTWGVSSREYKHQ